MRSFFPVCTFLAMSRSTLDVFTTGSMMFQDVRLKQLVFNYFGFFLFLVGLHQAEGTSTEMSNLNWKPFVYGGMASIVAEFGEISRACCVIVFLF